MNIGELSVIPLYDGSHFECAWDMFSKTIAEALACGRDMPAAARGGAAADWNPHRDLLCPDGALELTFGGFLIPAANGRLVLVDAGIGPHAYKGATGGRLLESLAAVGLSTDDVTDVVFTHLHGDHIGFAAPYGYPTFARATYRCHSADWDYFFGSNDIISERLAGVSERIEFWDREMTIAPGVDVRPMPGHTPGTTVIVLSSGTDRGLLLGDAVHSPVELVDDAWAGMGDIDPVAASRVRSALARELEQEGSSGAGGHFPGLRFGRLWTGATGRQWAYT
jgi:glyoxylase-like metal-dependent hydrolase (beta-lactamase superfamily II)